MKTIWKTDGSKSMQVSDAEYLQCQAMLAMLPDNGFMIPLDYCLILNRRRIPLREIALEKPTPPENSELNLDI